MHQSENIKIKLITIINKDESKQNRIDKLSERLVNFETGQKDWCKTLKCFTKPDLTNSIPPLSKDDNIYSDDNDKASILNEFLETRRF